VSREQSWFFDGYGVADLDPARMAYHRCTRALEDLVYPAAHVVDVHRYTEQERANALSIIRGVLSPTGLVSLALSSVRDLAQAERRGADGGILLAWSLAHRAVALAG
jgi:spectinomycin phosphotransferase